MQYAKNHDDPRPIRATTWNTSAAPGTRTLAPGLDQTAFERALRETLPGTYTLYQQFDPDRRQQVYEVYQNDNRLTSISAQVARRVSGKP